jgi:beta-lactamase regulating signal transducer with metallopeptidase domain
MIAAVLNHLWQSSLCVLGAGLLCLALRANQASARHSIWLAASLKFLLPFSALISLGQHLGWLTGATAAPEWTLIIGNITQPASIKNAFLAPHTLPAVWSYLGYLLAAGWFVGVIAVVRRWSNQWRQIKSSLQRAEKLDVGSSIESRSSASVFEPGVVGIIHPVLLIPADLTQRLPPEQMRAILDHEMSHVRRRDNLTAALHMVVEALFWFYPLVWWLGARLIAERERACDEAVVESGTDPQTYAEAILNVCKHYVASPLACASGVSGAELKWRIKCIMADCVPPAKLSGIKKILLATVASAAMTVPVVVGLFETRVANAQADDPFEALHGDSRVSSPPRFTIDSRSTEVGNGGKIYFHYLSFRAGDLYHLTADSAVGPFRGEPIFTNWKFHGNIKLHLPQGDLDADDATLHFKQKRNLLILDTAQGSWVAAGQTDAGTGIKNSLEIRYDIANNTVEIGSQTDAE